MARIAGVDLPKEKRVEIGLTYVYGIGRVSSNKILAQAGVNPDTRVRDLSDDEVKEVDLLLRRLSENAPKKGYKDKLKNFWEPSKPRKEYTDVKNALIEKGYNADDIDELLKGG